MLKTPTVCRKVIITGTGRAGTTFLVRLLTELGLDTGFTKTSWQRNFDEHCKAGLEREITDPDAPYIVKNPALCTNLGPLLASRCVEIEHAFIPIRDLDAAALSRVRIGGANSSVPGGLWLTDDPKQQRAALADVFHGLIHTLVAYEIPFTFLHFPRFVQDPKYAYRQLAPLLKDISWETFLSTFKRIADPTLIHDFSDKRTPDDSGKIGQQYLLNKKLQRRRRRIRRTTCITLIAAAVIALGFWCQG